MSGLISRSTPPPGDAAHDAEHRARTHQEAVDAEYSRVIAQHARLREEIRTLKKLLWREVARHRRAHRYTNAKDIEIALQHLD